MYFDRSYIFANRIGGFQSLADVVHDLARQRFLENKAQIELILTQLRLQIALYRCEQGDAIAALTPAFRFLADLGLYTDHVEPVLFTDTHTFYSEVCSNFPLRLFLQWFAMAIEKERRLVEFGVLPTTVDFILRVTRELCLKNNTALLFGPEFAAALESGDGRSIATVYSFFDLDDLRPLFNEHFSAFFSGRVSNLLKSQAGVAALISEFQTANLFVARHFPAESPLRAVIRGAFERALAPKSEAVAQLLASHLSSNRPVTPEEINFFKLSHPRDVFEITYSHLLTNRILAGRGVDIRRESALLEHFEEIAGAEITTHLRLILKDYTAAQERRFDAPGFSALILSRQLFGRNSMDAVVFPPAVQAEMDACAAAFIGAQEHIVVFWSSALSTVEVEVAGMPCIMSGDQLLILQAVRDGAATVAEIAAATHINKDTVQDNLTVMQRKEAGEIVEAAGDVYGIREQGDVKFVGPPPIRFPSVGLALAEREKGDVEAHIEHVKNNRIDCAIIQKMKVFKQLTVAELFAVVQKALAFALDQRKFLDRLRDLETKGLLEKIGEKTYKYFPV
jgi:hypothetical protein